MNLPALTIDEEFRSYIPALSPEERAQLEQNIVAEGCLDPLIVWGDILIDGHNRYEICTRLGLPYDTAQKFFVDREAALDWMDAHQLGRRNLSPDARKLLLGRRYNRLKKGDGERGPKKLGQNEPASTAAKLAREHGTSEATVKRAGKFAEEVDADDDLKAAVAAGVPVAKARPAPPPIAANDAAPPSVGSDERKLRRHLADLTWTGLIDEAVGYHAELTDLRAKLRAVTWERDSLKRQMREFLSVDGNEVVRRQAAEIDRQKSEMWRAKDDLNAKLATIAVLERKLRKADKRIKELEATSIDVAA